MLLSSLQSTVAASVQSMPQKVAVSASWTSNPAKYQQHSQKPTPNQNIRVPILEYHQADYIPHNSLGLGPHQFEQELKWLHAHNYQTINFGQLYAAFYFGYRLPEHPVLITFDDGYESVYHKAFPLLRKYHDQATIFMVSNYVNLHGQWRMLTEAELRTMERSGLVDVECHTVHHLDMRQVSDSTAMAEITQSAVRLEHIVGHPIRFFCWPSGHYRTRELTMLRKSGYLLATVQGHEKAQLKQGPYTLKRIVIHQNTPITSFRYAMQQ